jgi:hypothetical protein
MRITRLRPSSTKGSLALSLYLRHIYWCYDVVMNDTPLKPSQFFINAVSPQPQPLDSENYVIKTPAKQWALDKPKGCKGIHEVEEFLQGQASENVINEAIKNLSLYRQVHIKAA